MNNVNFLEKIAIENASLMLKMTTVAGSGHPSSCLSANCAMTYLINSKEPKIFNCDWNNFESQLNDKLIFSKGHASALFYVLFYNLGLIKIEELMTYRQFNSRLEGHPTKNFPFTIAPTGSLGQGLGIGLGVAIGQQNFAKTSLNINKVSKTFVLLGDSELAEGSNWESIAIAGFKQISNLIAIVDVNRLGQTGETMSGWNIAQIQARFQSFGWETIIVEDGNSMQCLETQFNLFIKNVSQKPSCIILKTHKGYGVSLLDNQNDWHGKVLSPDQLNELV